MRGDRIVAVGTDLPFDNARVIGLFPALSA
jgi:hypothetical protein